MTEEELLPLCECGKCGLRVTKPGNRFILGHANKGKKQPKSQKTRDKISKTLKKYNEDPKVRKIRSKGLIQYFIDNPEAIEINRLREIEQFANQKARDEMLEIMKNSEAHELSVEKQIGGNDLVDHHVAYDFGRPDALIVKVTRKFHGQIHHPKGIPLTVRGYSLID